MQVLFLVLVLTFSACSKSDTTAAAASARGAIPAAQAARPSGQPPAAAAVKPVPQQLPDILARVNGEEIRKAEFEKAVQAVEAQNKRPVPADERDRVYRGVLEQMIAYRLLLQETKARNIAVADSEIDARVGQIRSRFATEDAFKQALEQQHATLEQIRGDARSELLVTKMLQTEVDPKVSVKPDDVQQFYEKNPDRFKQPERVRASHILIRVPQNADAATKQQAKEKADAILKEIKGGKDFAALAKEYSQDPGSAVNGGDLNYFQRGQMVAPFDQAAFTLMPGQVSDVIETQFGYHIIKVVDRKASGTVPLAEVRTQVEQFLQNQARQQQTQALVQSLRAKGKVEILI